MDAFWVDLVKQVPALAVLCYMLMAFLGHLKHRDENDKTQQESCHNFQREMMAQATVTNTKVVTAFDRNTEALGRNNEATERLANVTEDIMRRLERHDARTGVQA